ncbi:MAG: RadC family protein [Firmicutes bacterium]|nr:RadC family protein [Bacillota bacterium]
MASVHDGHRQRMRERFISEGPKNFQTHELLEMVLYYTDRRKNTNVDAHRLLDEYGTLSALFEADALDIKRRCNVNESTALFFGLMCEILRRYDGDRWKVKMLIDSSDIAGEYAKYLLSNEKRECFYLICLDSQSRLLGTALISMGTINETHVYTRSIVEAALKYNSRSVIMAHNHPGGSIIPTSSDVETTVNIIKVLNMIDIYVADHIVVAGNEYLSMSDKSLVKNKI